MIKAVIFDLDGVLCGTDRFHFLAWREVFRTRGTELPPEAKDLVRGVERMKSLELLAERAGLSLSDGEKRRLAEEKNERYKELLKTMTPRDLGEKTARTLSALREMGLRLAVGSASKNAKTVLERLGLGGFFDAVSDGNGLVHPKPHPEVFLRAAEMLSLPPAECAVVEDARAGVEAAKRGGFTAIGMSDAASDPNADYSLGEFSDLVPLIKTIHGETL